MGSSYFKIRQAFDTQIFSFSVVYCKCLVMVCVRKIEELFQIQEGRWASRSSRRNAVSDRESKLAAIYKDMWIHTWMPLPPCICIPPSVSRRESRGRGQTDCERPEEEERTREEWMRWGEDLARQPRISLDRHVLNYFIFFGDKLHVLIYLWAYQVESRKGPTPS